MLSIEREEFLDTIKKRDIPRLKRFLEREPSLATTKDRNGVSAILVAIYYGNKEAADLIAAKKPELDVFEAASLGHLDQVKSLITRNRSRVNSLTPDGLTPLALAAFLGHDEVVEFLVVRGAARFGAQDGDADLGEGVPVRIELIRGRVEELEPSKVRGLLPALVDR